MFCQHGYVGGNRETLEIFPPQKKVSHHSDEPRLVESPRFVESVRVFVVLESVNTTHHLICAT